MSRAEGGARDLYTVPPRCWGQFHMLVCHCQSLSSSVSHITCHLSPISSPVYTYLATCHVCTIVSMFICLVINYLYIYVYLSVFREISCSPGWP